MDGPGPRQGRTKPPFEELYAGYYSNVLFYTLRKIGNREDAEDLTSDVFLYCYDHYDEYDPEKSAVTTWLYMVVNSRIKNYYRDHRQHTDISELENILEADGEEAERGVYLQQLRDMMAGALDKLPERQRQVVILKYFRDKSSAEIAEIMGISSGNARVLLSRALDSLEALCRNFVED